MKEEKVRKKRSQTEDEKPEVPDDFICIDTSQQPLVFDFLNGLNQEAEEVASIHLRLCLRCREIALIASKINRHLAAKSAYYLHPKQSELASETEHVS